VGSAEGDGHDVVLVAEYQVTGRYSYADRDDFTESTWTVPCRDQAA
jgi:hypothetical protein